MQTAFVLSSFIQSAKGVKGACCLNHKILLHQPDRSFAYPNLLGTKDLDVIANGQIIWTLVVLRKKLNNSFSSRHQRTLEFVHAALCPEDT